MAAVPAHAAGPSISGCWTQTSPFPYAQTPPGKEWGSRTWCFLSHGKMTRVHVACDRAGCDGWDLDGRYRWRRPIVWISDVDMSDDGKRQTKVWRRCRVNFPAGDRMVLENCYFSSDPWVREH
ncbi:hypothetical protein JQ632_17720 [Bradyrhizobium liaoningense]|nr:hypothetical protein [Bradyrhizobium liaoningense]